MFINTSLFFALLKYKLAFHYEHLIEALILDTGRTVLLVKLHLQRTDFQYFFYLEITSSKCNFFYCFFV